MTASGFPQTWRLLWRLAGYRPWLFAANLALWVAVVLLDLAPGPIARLFFDDLAGREHAVGAWGAIVLLVAQALVRTVVMTHAVVMEAFYRFLIGSLLRRNLLAGILRRPGADALPGSAGETANRFRDDAGEVGSLLATTNDFLASILFTAAALWFLMRIDAGITLLVFLPLAAVVAVTQRAFTHLAGFRKVGREATGQVTGLLGEMFAAVQAAQVAGAEARMIDHFRALSKERQRLMLRDTVLTQSLNAVTANVVGLGAGMVLLLAAGSMRAGRFTVGDFAVFAYYLEYVSVCTRFFGRVLAMYKQADVSTARMKALVPEGSVEALARHEPLYLRGPLPAIAPPVRTPGDRLAVLEASGLTYRYPGGSGIEDLRLRLARGTFTVVTGRIGSGKTTLLRVLLGLLPARAGQIVWNGAQVSDPASFFVPPRCAYTPQVPRLFSDTLRNNILLGLPEEPAALRVAVRAAVLERDVAALEHGLETTVGPRGVKLSGGQVQRAAAARMFVWEPALLVFDDLSSSLDVETERALWERLLGTPHPPAPSPTRGEGERRRSTVLAVSHRREALRRADRVIVLEGGRIVGEGTLDALLRTCGAMRRLWEADVGVEVPRV